MRCFQSPMAVDNITDCIQPMYWCFQASSLAWPLILTYHASFRFLTSLLNVSYSCFSAYWSFSLFGPLLCLSPMLTVFIASFLRSFKSMYACPKLKPSNSARVETCYASNSLICNSDSKLYARWLPKSNNLMRHLVGPIAKTTDIPQTCCSAQIEALLP